MGAAMHADTRPAGPRPRTPLPAATSAPFSFGTWREKASHGGVGDGAPDRRAPLWPCRAETFRGCCQERGHQAWGSSADAAATSTSFDLDTW
jgi:hypothetical protein